MIDNSELSTGPVPGSVAQLSELDWKSFETFATRTMRRYYARYRVEIVATKFSHDGGRDGEATYVLADDDREQSLAIVYRIWLEVKKRTGENVTLDDIGKNLVLASNASIQKLVVVTNSAYAPQVQDAVEKFSSRHGLSYSLVTGEHLLRLARSSASIDSLPTEVASTPTLDIRFSFSRQPNPVDARQTSDLHIQSGEPVFLIASIARTDRGAPSDFHIDVVPTVAGVVTLPYASSSDIRLSAEDQIRIVFVVLSPSASFSSETFHVDVHAPGREVCVTTIWDGNCRVARTLLSRWIPESRWQRLQYWASRITTWVANGGRLSFALVAYPGVGKSVMLNRLRPIWLGQSVREIYMHGGRHPRDADMASELFEAAFPIDPALLRENMVSAVEQWLIDCKMDKNRARKAASALCSDGFLPDIWGSKQLADLCASLVTRIAGRSRAVLVIEDLHFCAPSAIDLLKRVHFALNSLGVDNVAVVCTTRPYAAVSNDSVQNEWGKHLEEFLVATGIECVHLEAPTTEEAINLLARTIPTIEKHQAKIVVEQVGRTPLALREAVAWFLTERVIWRDQTFGEFVADPDRLRAFVVSDLLKDATRSRLTALRSRYPPWLSDLLDAAACVGRFFNLASVLPLGWEWDKVHNEALAFCGELDVIRPFEEGHYAFDHDLIRAAIVEMLDLSRQQRITASIADRPVFLDQPEVRGGLLYQAGSYRDAGEALRLAGLAAMARHRFGDAIKSLLLALTCIDPPAVKRTGQLLLMDVAIAHATPPQPRGPASDATRRAVLELLMALIYCTGSTAVFTSSAAASFLSEAAMLARSLLDQERLAELAMIEGTRAFERDELSASVKAHREAELLYASLPDALVLRANNLLRLAIAQRQQHRIKQAAATIQRAHRMVGATDMDLLVRLTLNAGAGYLASDLPRVARYWRAALRTATRANLVERRVHAMIDVGYLELLLGDDTAAATHLSTAYDLAREYELENSALRAASNLACLHLVRDDVPRALDLLRFAEEIGLRLEIGRRLWRVRANLATAYEATGEMERAYAIDSRFVANFVVTKKTISQGKRQALPILNIMLRANDHDLYRPLYHHIRPTVRYASSLLFRGVTSGVGTRFVPILRASLKTVRGVGRFIVTE
jgi:hypothetical protein